MARTHVIKAREHYGSNSLDLTLPASICKEHGIIQGDTFAVEIDEETIEGSKKLVLKYIRIYSGKE
jgi:hypothetical protein